MISNIERTLTNPWILWSLFGAGFFLPYLFILFLPSIGMIAWRHIRSEYGDTTEFWIKQYSVKSCKDKEEKESETKQTKPPIPALSHVPFRDVG